jgi:hypothetical protein
LDFSSNSTHLIPREQSRKRSPALFVIWMLTHNARQKVEAARVLS